VRGQFLTYSCTNFRGILPLIGMTAEVRNALKSRYPKAMIDTIETIIATTNIADRDAKVVVAKDNIMTLLKTHNGCYTFRFKPKQVAAHYKNRDNEVLTAEGCQRRGARVASAGCSLRVLSNNEPTCFEDHPETKRIAKEFLDVCKRPPKFATFKMDEMRAGSVS
jgi:hypothetical protein